LEEQADHLGVQLEAFSLIPSVPSQSSSTLFYPVKASTTPKTMAVQKVLILPLILLAAFLIPEGSMTAVNFQSFPLGSSRASTSIKAAPM